jgi:hypothetical protein
VETSAEILRKGTRGQSSPHERVRADGSRSEGTSASTYKKLRPFVSLVPEFQKAEIVRKSADQSEWEAKLIIRLKTIVLSTGFKY